MKKVLVLFLALITLASCSNMEWYKGAVIATQEQETLENGDIRLSVLGSVPHSKQDMIDALQHKGTKACGSQATIISHTFEIYHGSSTTDVGVINTESNLIHGVVRCTN